MAWRVLLTALYSSVLGAVMALENSHPGMSEIPLLAVLLMGPVVGFLVGRWWVLFAVIGAIVGRAIGWDAGENDGNPAFWPPYVLGALVLWGTPLLLGVAASQGWQSWRRRTDEAF
jgi:hypothetical protein